MNECEQEEFRTCEFLTSEKVHLFDELIRLLEIRLDELERRISLVESQKRSFSSLALLPKNTRIRGVKRRGSAVRGLHHRRLDQQ